MTAHFKSNLLGYISLEPFFMTNLHCYNVLDEDFVYKITLMYTEAGIYLDSFNSLKKGSIDFFRKGNRFYQTVKEYVDDVVSFDNLGIANFHGIFKVHFLFCSIVLFGFVIHLMINFIIKKTQN